MALPKTRQSAIVVSSSFTAALAWVQPEEYASIDRKGELAMPMTDQVPVGLFICEDNGPLRSLDEVVATYQLYKWQIKPGATGTGRMAYAVVSGNKETGEIFVLAVLEDATAPRHRHHDGGLYGEWIITISGRLIDVTDDGQEIILPPGTTLHHMGNTVHAPRATFWFGFYHQPRGSSVVLEDEPVSSAS